MTLQIDGSATAQASGTNSVTVTLTTSDSNDVIVVASFTENGGQDISSISASGLSFTKRKQYVTDFGAGSPNAKLEYWWAVASGPLSSESITINYAGTFDDAAVVAFGVNGANTSDPWDGNASLPAVNESTSGGEWTVSGVSTDNANAMLLAFGGSSDSGDPFNANGGGNAVSPFVWVNGIYNHSGSFWSSVAVASQVISSPASSASAQFSTSNTYWAGAVDAIVAPLTLNGASGSYAITGEAASAKFGLGLPAGSYSITGEVAALLGANELAGQRGIYSISGSAALLYRNVTGTWGSTEATDTFSASGTVIPSLALDGHATGGAQDSGSGITSATVSLTTTNDDDVIVLLVTTGGFFHKGHVTGISDTAGLTWKKRQQRYVGGGAPSTEIWWAHAPSPLSSDTITVTTTTTGAIAITAFGVVGANYTAPWDTATQAGGATDSYGSGNPETLINTNAENTFLIAFYSAQSVAEGGSITSPFTYVSNNNGYTEDDGYTMYNSFGYAVVDSAQSGLTASFAQSGGTTNERMLMQDAIVSRYETGTADAVLWFLDGCSASNIEVLTGGSQQVTANITTYNSDLVVVAAVLIQSSSGDGEVSSISDSLGISPWQRRSRTTDATGVLALEVWYAPAASAESGDITVHTENTVNGDVVAMMVFAVGGATGWYTGDFWDGDPALPALNHGTSGHPNAPEISTIAPNGLTLGFTANLSVPMSAVSPFTMTVPTILGADDLTSAPPNLQATTVGPTTVIAVEFEFNAAIQSGNMAEFSASPEPGDWVAIGDVMTVGPPVPPTGTWGSVESPDTFSATGFVPITGTMAATEAKDIPGGAPEQAPYDGIGWIGWVPTTGTLAVTEAKDTATLDGWVIGQPITGRMSAHEQPDRMAASNYSSVTGTWASTEAPDRLAAAGFAIPKVSPPLPRRRRILIVT